MTKVFRVQEEEAREARRLHVFNILKGLAEEHVGHRNKTRVSFNKKSAVKKLRRELAELTDYYEYVDKNGNVKRRAVTSDMYACFWPKDGEGSELKLYFKRYPNKT